MDDEVAEWKIVTSDGQESYPDSKEAALATFQELRDQGREPTLYQAGWVQYTPPLETV